MEVHVLVCQGPLWAKAVNWEFRVCGSCAKLLRSFGRKQGKQDAFVPSKGSKLHHHVGYRVRSRRETLNTKPLNPWGSVG